MTAPPPPPESTSYVAFLSYRHAEADRRWASWLLKRIETYRVPRRLVRETGAPRRLGRVFRDEEELSAASDLSATIREALAASRFLIVICSPRTPGSTWVNREVETFRDAGRGDRVLAFLVDGEPDASFPPALRALAPVLPDVSGAPSDSPRVGKATLEPLAADARPRHGLSAAQARRTALLRVLARLIGCRYDDLRQREAARRQRVLLTAAVAGAVLAAVMLLLALVAVSGRNTARVERDRARSMGLVQASIEAGTRDPMLALLLAREAHAVSEGAATRTQLRRALAASSVRGTAFDGAVREEPLVMSSLGDRALAVRPKGRALFFDGRARTLAELRDLPEPCCPSFSGDGATLALLGPRGSLLRVDREGRVASGGEMEGLGQARALALDGESAWTLHGKTVRRFVLRTLEVASVWTLPTDDARSLLPVPGTPDVLVGFQRGAILRSGTQGVFQELATQASPVVELHWQVPGAVLLAGGDSQAWTRHDLTGARKPLAFEANRLAVTAGAGVRAVYEIGALTLFDANDVAIVRYPLPSLNALVADATEPEFLAVTAGGELHVLTAKGKARRVLPGLASKTWAAACARGATVLLRQSDVGGFEIDDLGPGELGSFGSPSPNDAVSPWSPDGSGFLSLEGPLVVVRDRDGAVRTVLRGPSVPVTAAAFSPDGALVAAGDREGGLTTWRSDGALVHRVEAHVGPLLAVRFDPARPGRLVSSGQDRTAAIWDAEGALVARLRGHREPVQLLAISSDGARILTSDGLDAARIWDGDGLPLLLLASHGGAILEADFFLGSRSVALIGETLAVAYDAEGRLLALHAPPARSDEQSRFAAWARPGDTFVPRAAALTPSGHLALFGPRLRLLDAAGREVTGTHRSASAAGFGRGDQRAVTWDLGLSAELWTLGSDRGLRLGGHGSPLTACTFGLADHRFATGAADGSIHVRTEAGELVEAIPGAGSAVRSLLPSPDGARLLSKDASSRMRLLLVLPAEVAALARARALRELNDAERATYADLLGSAGPDTRAALLERAARAFERTMAAGSPSEAGAPPSTDERELQDALDALYPGTAKEPGLTLLFDELTGELPELGRRLAEMRERARKEEATRGKLSHLRTLLEDFRQKQGRYPSGDEGLLAVDPDGRALTEDEVGSSAILDDWGAFFLYVPKGAGFDLSSAGPDGRHGTDDDLR